MNLTSKQFSLGILVITSVICSRVMFSLFNDPEGPNLLIVVVFAAALYGMSLGAYILATSNHKKLLFAICIQVLVATISFICLK